MSDRVGGAATADLGALAASDAVGGGRVSGLGFGVAHGDDLNCCERLSSLRGPSSVTAMLQVIGAGLPRTGTHSLKLALMTLLGGRCYHMSELFENLDDVAQWRTALDGDAGCLAGVLDGYTAAVDWPASALWPELAAMYPSALIVLSTRADAEGWWRSMDATIMEAYRTEREPEHREWSEMAVELWHREIGPTWEDPAMAIAAYERHNREVRASAPSGRLLDWSAVQGWAPLCTALDLPVPEEPFPHVNSTEEWEERRRSRELG
ncbi:MAG: sulfotransferase family protein [Nocardioidaceae bacterium]